MTDELTRAFIVYVVALAFIFIILGAIAYVILPGGLYP